MRSPFRIGTNCVCICHCSHYGFYLFYKNQVYSRIYLISCWFDTYNLKFDPFLYLSLCTQSLSSVLRKAPDKGQECGRYVCYKFSTKQSYNIYHLHLFLSNNFYEIFCKFILFTRNSMYF